MKILYEDNYLIAVLKKDKLLTIESLKEKEKTLYHEVSDYLKKKNKKNKIFIIHRLDFDTSGIVLFAKDEKTKKIMQDNWSNVKREYIAIVSGTVKKDHDVIKSYLKETKTLLTYSNYKGIGKLALTQYEVLKRSQNFTMLKINLITGRKNQIRVHLKDIGNPIVGDKKYGIVKNTHMLLHANLLEFKHPYENKILSIKCELPTYFDIM